MLRAYGVLALGVMALLVAISQVGRGAGDAPANSTGASERRSSAAAADWGTIKGTVVFDGTAPPPKVVHKKGDTSVKNAETCAAQDMLDQSLVVSSKNNGIKWALVYVNKPPAIHPDLMKVEGVVELGQKACVFEPRLLAFRQGQALKLTSSDLIAHNTNLKPWRGDGINVLLPAAPANGKSEMDGPSFPTQPRPFPVSCDIHGWMAAFVMVLDHPYFAVTDETGSFEIKNVPAGKLSLVVWQERCGYGEGLRNGKEIDVPAGGVVELKLPLKLPK